ncbi:hypothetical protein [Chlamydia caviae]|uniref:Uncharacterized protein n=1 Tax=Chlamydia caviae (strain ATCC VR-813 / DSM 19441 / 03DC25 / GPIC) TaxID=227941 RepID=Q821Z0_CHLCV|nr:hypothetical protein [Chlamydia caviae]AAP05536.1 hypothetical protein CCA_00795 [Chlamydia caviae GPIC]
MDGVSNYTGTNVNRSPVCFTVHGPQGHRVVNITAMALSSIIFGAQIAVRVASHAKLGSLHVVFVTLTIIVSILLVCVAVYNLFHLCTSVREHQDEKESLDRRVRNLEMVEQELNRQLQAQRLELDCLGEEIILQINRAEHSESKFGENLHRFAADKADLEQQLQLAREEITNLSQELESRLEAASMEIEPPYSDEEMDEDADWFEANNILGSPTDQQNVAYMVMDEGNADDEASTSSERESPR